MGLPTRLLEESDLHRALAAAYAANGVFEAAARYEEQAIKSGKLGAAELQEARASLDHYSRRQKERRASP
ncbi:MAG: hypothetical protein ABIU29_10460 [Chthoniobacterales bacterium]